ncbi:hypothetical protein ACQJBY_048231 [Aegilops geniculata]
MFLHCVASTTPCSRRFIYAPLLTLILSLATMAASSSSSQPDEVLPQIPCPKCLRWSPSSLAAELGTTSASGKIPNMSDEDSCEGDMGDAN